MCTSFYGFHDNTPVYVWMSVCACACVCVCLPLRLLITSGMLWTPYDWFKSSTAVMYMATVVGIGNGHGLGIDTCCVNNPVRVS